MIVTLFNLLIHDPLYNALVFLIGIVPLADVGIAVIILTLLVKLILFPLAKQAIKTQVTLKEIGPRLEEIKKKYKDNQQEQVKQTLAVYKENDIHPLSGILTLFIQLPIILGLYWVFFKGGLPDIDPSDLYAFVSEPDKVNMIFIGLVDMGGRSIVLALLAGATQFIHARIAIKPPETKTKPGESLKDDLARSMSIQMRYVLPVIVGVIAYTISSAVALYWTTSNLFTIGQELIVRRKIRDKQK
jgi:YidC/Oxa1 family membrane protein insertase